MTSDLGRALRRLKPLKQLVRLSPRPHQALPFADLARPPPRNLLLDSTVYIDELKGRLPAVVETLLQATTLWHSPVTAAELAIGIGLLDPHHPDTAGAMDLIAQSVEKRPLHRTLATDSQIWAEAALAAGILARLQRSTRANRVRLLNDALIFFTACKHGCAVLTRNVVDFDLLAQIAGVDRVLFYRVP